MGKKDEEQENQLELLREICREPENNSFNLVSIFNPNENDYTNFLYVMLNADKTILDSFLKKFIDSSLSVSSEILVTVQEPVKPEKNSEIDKDKKAKKGFVDCIIKDGNKFCVIIENKIKGAKD